MKHHQKLVGFSVAQQLLNEKSPKNYQVVGFSAAQQYESWRNN